MSKVLIIHAGGTIGMTKGKRGLRPTRGAANDVFVRLIEESSHTLKPMPHVTVEELPTPIDSANATPDDWNVIAHKISEHYDDFDGFVVTHGTDTMAHTASALSFLLQFQRKPVVLTGAQIPISDPRSDGRCNLSASVHIAGTNPSVDQVLICFGSKILRGNRATKVSSSHFDAFASPMVPETGHVGIRVKMEKSAKKSQVRPQKKFSAHQPSKKPTIGCLRLFPGINVNFMQKTIESGVDGLIIEAYGSGTAPDKNKELLRAIRNGVENGVRIMAVTQPLYGAANLGSYAASSALKDCGVVDGRDITTEAATTKMYYLLSMDMNEKTVNRNLNQSIRGEVTID
ncbi:MAG: asparaginase [Sandaracinaceae bacterium]